MDGGYGFDFAANKPFSNGSNLGFSYYHDEKGQRWQRTDVKTDAMGLEYNNYSGLLIGLLHNFRVNAVGLLRSGGWPVHSIHVIT